MNEKIICRAEIEGGCSKTFCIFFCVIIAILTVMGFDIIPPREYYDYFDKKFIVYSWYGIEYLVIHPDYKENAIMYILLIPIGIIFLFFLWRFIIRFQCKRCALVLTDSKVYGRRKWFFVNEELQIPLKHIDNVLIRRNFWDILYGGGGKTIKISSNSGYVKFPCVQNAESFTSTALKQLEIIHKKSEASVAPVVIKKESSIDEKFKTLQNLKEQGIISEEEYNAKKAELLNKL